MALTKIKADGLTADLIDETKLADNSIDSEHYNDGSIDNAHLADDAVGVAELSATGTASSSTFLRGDNSWAAVTSTTINNNADNRIITGSGTANTLNGESSLTYDSGGMAITGDSDRDGLKITQSGNNYGEFMFNSNRSSSGNALGIIRGEWNSTEVASIYLTAGSDTTNKDDGQIRFFTSPDSGTGIQTRMLIDSSGNVGIGTTSPSTALQVHKDWVSNYGSVGVEGSQNALVGYALRSNGAYKGALIFRDGTSGDYLDLGTFNGNHPILFKVNATEEARIDNEGLKFNGDTATANALNDYEEGTWTPVPNLTYNPSGRSITIGSSSGTYTKIGRMVLIEYLVQWTAISGSGAYNVGCSGLPFAAEGTQTVVCGCIRSNVTGNTFVAESLQNNEINVFRQYNNGSPNTNDSMSGFAVYHTT